MVMMANNAITQMSSVATPRLTGVNLSSAVLVAIEFTGCSKRYNQRHDSIRFRELLDCELDAAVTRQRQ